jgi:hypothetical protein
MSLTSTTISDVGMLTRWRAGLLGRTSAWHVVLVLLVVANAIIDWLAYHEFVFEDAYITYAYAESIASGRGFVFNEGERVLGTTTPLYTLLLAILRLAGLAPPLASGVIFWVSLAGFAALGALLLRRLGHPGLGLLYAFVLMLGPLDLRRLYGLETPFHSLLLLGAIAMAVRRRPWLTGLFLGLAFLTRYDGFLLSVCLLPLWWLVDRKPPWRTAVCALAVVLPWLVFAQLYFGSVMPNTLEAKAGETDAAAYLYEAAAIQVRHLYQALPLSLDVRALQPIWVALLGLFGIMAPIFAAADRILRREPILATLIAFPFLLWIGYSLIGPPLAHSWHLVPGTLLLILMSVACWGEVADRVYRAFRPGSVVRLRPLVIVAVGTAMAMISLLNGRAAAEEAHAWLESNTYRGRIKAYRQLALWINDRGLGDLTVMMREPGYFRYLVDNRLIDAAGLTTADVFFHGPADRRTEPTELLETYRPDLIVTPPREWPDLPVAGYLPLVHSSGLRSLLIRRSVFRDRYAAFRGRWLEATPYWPGDEVPGRHPIVADFSGPDLDQGWELDGGLSAVVGNVASTLYDGKPVEESHLHTRGRSGLWGAVTSPPFVIDFDTLSFRFGGAQATQARLLVDGQAVLTIEGSGRPELRDFEWPVHAWVGKVAVLQFVDTNQANGFLVADHVRSIRYQKSHLIDDFESGIYGRQWRSTFDEQPRPLSDVAADRGLVFQIGSYGALSAGLQGKREMTSTPFVIEADRFSFLVLDFGGPLTKVELLVAGRVVRAFRGSKSEAVVPVVWDVERLRGKEAVLSVIDEQDSAWSWIGVDEIRVMGGPER